jgi:hypothetical protein
VVELIEVTFPSVLQVSLSVGLVSALIYVVIAARNKWTVELIVALQCIVYGAGIPGGASLMLSALMPAMLFRVVNAQGQVVQNPPGLRIEVEGATLAFILAGGFSIVFLSIANLRSVYKGRRQKDSCFISHSSADKEFARRLCSRMRDEGIRAWFDEEDMKAGREVHPQIDAAIRTHDKFLLILSEASMHSAWVAREIRRTRLAERREGQRKLFPIRLVDFSQIKAWELLDNSSGEDLAEVVRKFFIPDFSNWKDHESFEASFARLLRDLKAEESTGDLVRAK